MTEPTPRGYDRNLSTAFAELRTQAGGCEQPAIEEIDEDGK